MKHDEDGHAIRLAQIRGESMLRVRGRSLVAVAALQHCSFARLAPCGCEAVRGAGEAGHCEAGGSRIGAAKVVALHRCIVAEVLISRVHDARMTKRDIEPAFGRPFLMPDLRQDICKYEYSRPSSTLRLQCAEPEDARSGI
eukprot:5036569-Pleurochrysis_carterae.AAC.2